MEVTSIESLEFQYFLSLCHEANIIGMAVFMIDDLIKIVRNSDDILAVYGMGDMFGEKIGQMEKYNNLIEKVENIKVLGYSELQELTEEFLSFAKFIPRDLDIGMVVNDYTEKNFPYAFGRQLKKSYKKLVEKLKEDGLIGEDLKSIEKFNGYDYKGEGSWSRSQMIKNLKDDGNNLSIPLRHLLKEKRGCVIYLKGDDCELIECHKNIGIPPLPDKLKNFESYLKNFGDACEKSGMADQVGDTYLNMKVKALKKIEELTKYYRNPLVE